MNVVTWVGNPPTIQGSAVDCSIRESCIVEIDRYGYSAVDLEVEV